MKHNPAFLGQLCLFIFGLRSGEVKQILDAIAIAKEPNDSYHLQAAVTQF